MRGPVLPTANSRQPSAVVVKLRRALGIVRTIIGAPDYERYVQHMRARHATCDVVSRDEFIRQRLESRYSRPGSRCC